MDGRSLVSFSPTADLGLEKSGFGTFNYIAAALLGLALLVVAPAFAQGHSAMEKEPEGTLHDPREVHLAEVRQLTFEGENAEAYWSPSGKELIFQRSAPPFGCDQIFRLRPEAPEELQLVSTGKGRTTCAYYAYPEGQRILYASTHAADPECPPRPDFSQGYVWPIYDTYEIYSADLDGGDLRALTENSFYDAEATVCPVDGAILFTSTRDGDLDLYRMDADGGNVQRLTTAPGYDGGAFFSADCQRIVWRASRPAEGQELEDYQRLLAEGLVRPGELEIWVANADGSEARQVTYLEAGTFAPYFHPSGERILFSSNFGDPRGREFDIWAVNVDGTNLERITYTPGFDGFPMFSPDGKTLAFASNRNQGKPGETDVYVARWVEGETATNEGRAERLLASVRWLADDQREGRGLGTDGLRQAAAWLEEEFRLVGLSPGADDGYLQGFDAPVRVEAGSANFLELDGKGVDGDQYRLTSFSSSGEADGEILVVGHGITAAELEWDDYAGLDAAGKIVLVRRFAPEVETFADGEAKRRYGDLRYKAWNAREHGAVGLIIVDFPELAEGQDLPEEAPFPQLRVDGQGDAGLPTVVLSRAQGEALFAGSHRARIKTELLVETERAHNVVGKLEAPAGQRLGGALIIGAHYDHLGMGGSGSLAPDLVEAHNGADDNASGTAALLEIGRFLAERRDELRRDVYVVAFSGEESGLLGSTEMTRNPPRELELTEAQAMLNLDMVGRLRKNTLSVLGAESAEEWKTLVPPLCDDAGVVCSLGGDGYGPSDQTPFYAAGLSVLHFFTGSHGDYHKPYDDTEKVNAIGLAKIVEIVAGLSQRLAGSESTLTYRKAPAPVAGGDARSYGASLGTIPDYTGGDEPGVLLADTRPDGPAARAGMRRGDILVELSGHEIRDIHDFMFVLRQAKPEQESSAVVVREGERVELRVTFGKRRSIR